MSGIFKSYSVSRAEAEAFETSIFMGDFASTYGGGVMALFAGDSSILIDSFIESSFALSEILLTDFSTFNGVCRTLIFLFSDYLFSST